jgi:hypothetical protein
VALNLPSPADVRTIIETDLDDTGVQGFIDDAAALARRCVTPLDEDLQKTILKWLAAHLIQVAGKSTGEGFSNVAVTSMKLGDASETYARGQVGTNIASTPYGQQAILLDPNGCLMRLGNRKPIFKVL